VNAQAGIVLAIVTLSVAGCGKAVTLTNSSPTQYLSQTARQLSRSIAGSLSPKSRPNARPNAGAFACLVVPSTDGIPNTECPSVPHPASRSDALEILSPIAAFTIREFSRVDVTSVAAWSCSRFVCGTVAGRSNQRSSRGEARHDACSGTAERRVVRILC
jgi:hypothetical protein